MIAFENPLLGIKEIAGIQLLIAQEFEGRSVKIIIARLGHRIDNGPRETAVFGVEGVGDQAKLLDRIESGHDGCPVVPPFLDVSPIHQKGVGRFPLPIYRNVAGAARPTDRAIRELHVRCDGNDTGLQSKQVDVTAAVQREVRHLAVFDDVSKLGTGAFHLNGTG